MIFVGKVPVAKPSPAKKNGKAPAPAKSDDESSEDDSDDDDEPQSKVVPVKGSLFVKSNFIEYEPESLLSCFTIVFFLKNLTVFNTTPQ